MLFRCEKEPEQEAMEVRKALPWSNTKTANIHMAHEFHVTSQRRRTCFMRWFQ
jgi:hypothetical protein